MKRALHAYGGLLLAPAAAFAALFVTSTLSALAIGLLRGYVPSFHLQFITSVSAVRGSIAALTPLGEVASQVAGEAGTLAVMALCLRRTVSLRDVFDRRPRVADLGWGLLSAFGLVVLADVIGTVLYFAHALRGSPSQHAFAIGIGSPWLLLLLAAVVGFAEEATFRGFLLRAFRTRMPIWLAVILESAVFGLFHAGWGLAPGPWLAIFALGIALTLLALRSHIYVAMIAHAGYDFLVFLVILHMR